MNTQGHDRHARCAERIQVNGRVQGVGYRYHVCDVARRAGLVGWVRNRLDGSVELLAQGTSEALELLVVALGEGPPLARVTSVDRVIVDVDPERSGFRIRA